MKYENLPNKINHALIILSGLLLGLSLPGFSFLPLGFLAWFWLVPLLLELKKTENFKEFIKCVSITLSVAFVTIMFWLVTATPLGFLLAVIMGVIVFSVPFFGFYFIWRKLNWQAALFSLAFFWTAWEWFYHSTEFSLGTIQLAHTQAENWWLIQFIDLTGAFGIAFWIVLVNVSIVFAIEQRKGEREKERRGILGQTCFLLPFSLSPFLPSYFSLCR